MRLMSLKLQNYIGIYNGLGLNEIFIDFSKCIHRILIIKGDNGSGKSTLFKAMTPLPDASVNFIPKMRATKKIEYMLEDNSILSIFYESDVRDNGDRKPTRCKIFRFYADGKMMDLNPNGNMTTAKEVIYSVLDLDDNFVFLSQISANKKGLGGLKPAERKRYVNTILSSVSAYNSMHKMFTTKSSTLRSMIDSILAKMNQLGNTENIYSSLMHNQESLKVLESKKEELITSLSSMKTKLNVLDPDGNLVENYKKVLYDKIITENQIKEIPDLEEYDEQKLIEYEKRLSALQSKEEVYSIRATDLMSKEKNIQDQINALKVKLEGMYDLDVIKNLELEIENTKFTLDEAKRMLEDIGFTEYYTITPQEYDIACDTITSFNSGIYSIADKYDRSMREYALHRIKSKGQYNYDASYRALESVNKKINDYKLQLEKRKMYEKEAEKYDLIPSNCNNKESCIFIKDIVESKKLLDSIPTIDEINSTIEAGEKTVKELQEAIELSNTIDECVKDMKMCFNLIPPNIRSILRKFPKTEFLDKDENIYDDICQGLPINLDMVRYKDYRSRVNLVQDCTSRIIALKNELEKKENDGEAAILKNKLESLNKDLLSITNEKKQVVDQIATIKNEMLEIQPILDKIHYAKINQDKYRELHTKIDELVRKEKEMVDASKECSELTESISKTESELNALSMQDIPSLRSAIDQAKYQLVLFDDYKKDLDKYNTISAKLNILKKYTSINGIQTVYMSVFMNSILVETNKLLQFLFGGRFSLLQFVINEDEFCIPCVDSEGNMRPDISLMSDSQLSMISMLISFVLLHKASSIYNIINLDEVDDNLDSMNRIQFSILIEQIMNNLRFDQCVIISHNNEIDMSNCDVVALRIENTEMLNGIYNSGANIVYSYQNLK